MPIAGTRCDRPDAPGLGKFLVHVPEPLQGALPAVVREGGHGGCATGARCSAVGGCPGPGPFGMARHRWRINYDAPPGNDGGPAVPGVASDLRRCLVRGDRVSGRFGGRTLPGAAAPWPLGSLPAPTRPVRQASAGQPSPGRGTACPGGRRVAVRPGTSPVASAGTRSGGGGSSPLPMRPRPSEIREQRTLDRPQLLGYSHATLVH